ncbi:hypothetical protein BT69DRAFT_1276122 [Atractiella rhizophila]|nr:hypothetical protein BT69DRAFT_1276122 [Atractiella rhizophila]
MSDQENNTRTAYKRKYSMLKAQLAEERKELSLLQNIVARGDDERQQWEEERAQLQEQLAALQEAVHFASNEPPSKRRRSTRVMPAAPTRLAKIQAYHAGKASVLLYHPWAMRFENIFLQRSEVTECEDDREIDGVSDDEEWGEDEDEDEIREKKRRNQMWEVCGQYYKSNFVKFILGRLPPEALEWHNSEWFQKEVCRGISEQKSDNAKRMQLRIPKKRQEDEEVHKHIEEQTYLYAPYNLPAHCSEAHKKAVKAGAYLRSTALFKVARIIIHGPAAINSTTEKARASTIGKELSIFQITIPLMAYCSTLARYALSADPIFAAEGRVPILPNAQQVNNYRDHFQRTVTLLDSLQRQHADKFHHLIQLWNREVFPRDDARDNGTTLRDETADDKDILDGFGMDFMEEQGGENVE